MKTNLKLSYTFDDLHIDNNGIALSWEENNQAKYIAIGLKDSERDNGKLIFTYIQKMIEKFNASDKL